MTTNLQLEPDLVSIIMPAHNSERFIDETIGSVLAQTYRNWELIVVDDRSTDATPKMLERLAQQDGRIRPFLLGTNSGAAVARNTAIEHARGRYIAFLDSDDLWLPHKLARQITFMQESGSPFTYASYERITEDGRPIGSFHVPARATYGSVLKRNVIGCLTAVYDSQYFGKTFMPLIRKGQDHGLWLFLLRRVDHATGIGEILGRYRVRENSISSNKLESSRWVWRLYREVLKLNLIEASYNFAFYALSGVTSRLAERVKAKVRKG